LEIFVKSVIVKLLYVPVTKAVLAIVDEIAVKVILSQSSFTKELVLTWLDSQTTNSGIGVTPAVPF